MDWSNYECDEQMTLFDFIPNSESQFCLDEDVNEIVSKLDEICNKYDTKCSKKKWGIWDHVPQYGYRLIYEVAYKELDKKFYDDLDKIVEFAKEKGIELSPCSCGFAINGVDYIHIYSTYLDKQRRKRKR